MYESQNRIMDSVDANNSFCNGASEATNWTDMHA